MMNVIFENNAYFVVDDDYKSGPFSTNALAWDFVDKLLDEPNSPIKARYAWSQDQAMKGE